MAHPEQMAFFADVIGAFPAHFAGRVLDVGSNDLLGGPHTLLTTPRYVGVDLAAARNVDVVARGEALPFPRRRFDVTMSSECFEHARGWRRILVEMVAATRPGGLVVVSAAATGRPEHGTTRSDGGSASPASVARGEEWYRNLTPGRVRRSLVGLGLAARIVLVDRAAGDVYLVAVVRPARPGDAPALGGIRCSVRARCRSSRPRRPLDERILLRIAGDRGLAAAKAVWAGARRAARRVTRRDGARSG